LVQTTEDSIEKERSYCSSSLSGSSSHSHACQVLNLLFPSVIAWLFSLFKDHPTFSFFPDPKDYTLKKFNGTFIVFTETETDYKACLGKLPNSFYSQFLLLLLFFLFMFEKTLTFFNPTKKYL
jgi:hypothetical protein